MTGSFKEDNDPMPTTSVSDFLGASRTHITRSDLGTSIGRSGKTLYECRFEGCPEFPWPTEAQRDAHEAECTHKQARSIPQPSNPRFETVDNGFGGTTTRPTSGPLSFQRGSQAANPATERQIKFLTDLVAEVYPDGSFDALRDERIAEGFDAVKAAITKLIPKRDALRAAPTQQAPAPAQEKAKSRPHVRNRYAQECDECKKMCGVGEGVASLADDGKWVVIHNQCPMLVVFPFPLGRYAVEMDGVMKFYACLPEGLFAQASDELHSITKPENIKVVIDAIAVDPKAASIRYGIEFETCGRCGRGLTSEWRKAGIGPVCAKKAWN